MKPIFKSLLIILVVISCDDIVEVEDISNSIVTILAPTDDVTLTAADITFSWQAVSEAETYTIQIATPNFENATQIILDSTIITTSFTKLLVSGDYEWRIKAENSGYSTAYTAQNLSISPADVVNISNATVSLLAPADAVIFNTSDTINFSWDSTLGADNYTIQIATPNFANATQIVENQTVTATNFSISNLIANSYEWRVKAINTNYQTNYTAQVFTVEE
ncbi:hypothetical protein [uncultured Lacinutrix sp.]|uniref:hypothetical protein n=1 Tax=uncultured Lacinutrix sp. TaxID=574032 RepID=UPI002615522D|nr:hypothetical protein [uncultured Lacinutrix sp.]